MFRNLRLPAAILTFLAIAASARAGGFLYYTGFETNPAPPATSFPTGDDVFYTTPTPDSWSASSSHNGLKLHSIAPETAHSQIGLGNAVEIGGYATSTGSLFTFRTASSSQTVRVLKPFGLDPVAANQEIVTLSVIVGISDSTGVGNVRRDLFEFAFLNQASQLIGCIQFDNNTLDSSTFPAVPARRIYRSTTGGKVDTGVKFYHDTLMHLVVRINFRTNRWSAYLDGLAIFSEEVFYSDDSNTAKQARTLGLISAQMVVKNRVAVSLQEHWAPGDNYMLFDDFLLRADPLPDAEIYDLTGSATGSVSFTWLAEARYRYQVQYTDDLATPWLDTLPGSLTTATTSGISSVFTDATATGRDKRFYRIKRSYP